MTLTLIGSPKTRAFRAMWLLEELGLPYTHIAALPQSAEVRAHNPAGKVPVLLVGDQAITDSAAILTYLCDREARFTHPPGTLARAAQDSLTHLLLDEFDAVLWTAARHSFVLPQDMRLPAIKVSLKSEFAANAARLSARLTGPFLMGDAMTLPDILLTHCLRWAANAQFPDPGPVLTDYFARMTARPAYLRAMGG